jgi:hypothetical protein
VARVLTLAALGLAIAVALASRPAAPPAEAQVQLVGGTLSMSNSRDGAAILTAAGMAPGESRGGDLTIANTGSLTGTFSLSKSSLTDTPGPGGGSLSSALYPVVPDVTDLSAPTTVYVGKLGAMGPRALGDWAPGTSRRYRFTVSLPDGGAPLSATSGDNAYQGSAVSVRYDWTATGDEPPSGGGGGGGGGDGGGGAGAGGGGGGVPRPAPRPGPGGGPGAAPLKLTVTGKKRQPLLRQRGLIVFARCSEACSISATAKGAKTAKKVKVSAWRGRTKPGSPVKIKLRLSKKATKVAKKALKRRKPTAVTVTVRAKGGTGKSTVRRLKISLR